MYACVEYAKRILVAQCSTRRYIVECASVKCYFPVQTCFMNIFLKCNTVSYFKAYIFHNDLASPHFHPNPSIGWKKITHIFVTNIFLFMGYSMTCLWKCCTLNHTKKLFGERPAKPLLQNPLQLFTFHTRLLIMSLFVDAPRMNDS